MRKVVVVLRTKGGRGLAVSFLLATQQQQSGPTVRRRLKDLMSWMHCRRTAANCWRPAAMRSMKRLRLDSCVRTVSGFVTWRLPLAWLRAYSADGDGILPQPPRLPG